MKITYIHHSSFLVEDGNKILLFDYYKGKLPAFAKNADIYIFASHQHGDHFTLEVLKWQKEYKNITYIFGSDIRLNEKYLDKKAINKEVLDKIHRMGGNQEKCLNDMKVETLRSTDQGVAFIVSWGNRCIYHAGDLNWWNWQEESELFNRRQEMEYKKTIRQIEGRHFDAAFVPTDPRLQDAYADGISYFMKHTDTAKVFPMHFWEDYTVIRKLILRECAKGNEGFGDRIVEILAEGEQWEV